MEQKSFTEQLKEALVQSYVWERQHPTEHLSQYDLINITLENEIIMQILTLQRNESYGFVIHSYINPNHPIWLSPVGLMFGKGELFKENGEQTLICSPDPEYIAHVVEKILLAVYGKIENIHVKRE